MLAVDPRAAMSTNSPNCIWHPIYVDIYLIYQSYVNLLFPDAEFFKRIFPVSDSIQSQNFETYGCQLEHSRNQFYRIPGASSIESGSTWNDATD